MGTFDATKYFEELISRNKLARSERFRFCRITSVEAAEELLTSMRRETSFFAITEATDGNAADNGSGYFRRKIYTCFLMRRFKTGDETERAKAMEVCYTLRDQLYTRMLVDAEQLASDLIYLDVATIYEHDLPNMTLNGCCGLFFTFSLDTPLSLEFDADAWEES